MKKHSESCSNDKLLLYTNWNWEMGGNALSCELTSYNHMAFLMNGLFLIQQIMQTYGVNNKPYVLGL